MDRYQYVPTASLPYFNMSEIVVIVHLPSCRARTFLLILNTCPCVIDNKLFVPEFNPRSVLQCTCNVVLFTLRSTVRYQHNRLIVDP